VCEREREHFWTFVSVFKLYTLPTLKCSMKLSEKKRIIGPLRASKIRFAQAQIMATSVLISLAGSDLYCRLHPSARHYREKRGAAMARKILLSSSNLICTWQLLFVLFAMDFPSEFLFAARSQFYFLFFFLPFLINFFIYLFTTRKYCLSHLASRVLHH
jgi:hypothetical protein